MTARSRDSPARGRRKYHTQRNMLKVKNTANLKHGNSSVLAVKKAVTLQTTGEPCSGARTLENTMIEFTLRVSQNVMQKRKGMKKKKKKENTNPVQLLFNM